MKNIFLGDENLIFFGIIQGQLDLGIRRKLVLVLAGGTDPDIDGADFGRIVVHRHSFPLAWKVPFNL